MVEMSTEWNNLVNLFIKVQRTDCIFYVC